MKDLPKDIKIHILSYLDDVMLWKNRRVNKDWKENTEHVAITENRNGDGWQRFRLQRLASVFVEGCKNGAVNVKSKDAIKQLASSIIYDKFKEISAYSTKQIENKYEKIKKLVRYAESILDIIYKTNQQLTDEQKIKPILKGATFRIDDDCHRICPAPKFDYWVIIDCTFDAFFLERGEASWKGANLNNITFGINAAYDLEKLAEANEIEDITFSTIVIDLEEGPSTLDNAAQNALLKAYHEVYNLKKECQNLKRQLESLINHDDEEFVNKKSKINPTSF